MKTVKRTHLSKRAKGLSAGALAVALALAVSGCSGGGSGGSGDVKIGLAAAFTGNAAFLGPALDKGAKVALKDINGAGGVDGRQVKLDDSDTGGTAEGAVSAVDKLLKADKVSGLVGPTSVTVMSVLDRIQASQVPTMVLGSTAALDSTIKGQSTFRVTPSDTLMAPAMADLAIKQGFHTCSIVTESLEGAQSIHDNVKKAFIALGGTIDRDISLAAKQPSYRSEILKLLAPPVPKCIFIEVSPESGAQFWQNASESSSIANPLFIGTDTLLNSDSTKTLKPVADKAKIVAVSPASVGPGRDTYVKLYKKSYPSAKEPADLSDLSYDSTVILALAMEDAKSTDPGKYVSHVRTVSNDGQRCLSYSACKKLLDSGKDINFDGASGADDISADGNSVSGFGVFTIKNGSSSQTGTITEQAVAALAAKMGS
jgi:branched-chain amino acid transport system substrate-binding protein